MTDEQIRQLVSSYLRQTLKDEEDDPTPLDPEEHAEALDTRELLLEERREELALKRYDVVHNVADGILEEAGITLPNHSPAYRKLCHELLKGIIEAEVVGIERMKGNYLGNDYDRQASYLSSPARPVVPAKKDEGESLSKLIDEYVNECMTGGKWRGRTKQEADGCLKLFLRIVGAGYPLGENRGIRTLDRRAFVDFRDTLTKWPSNANKKPQYRGKSVAEVLAIRTDAPLSVTSINKYVTYVTAFIAWAVANGYAETNFAEGLSISKKNLKASEDREPYSAEDLRKLLMSPIYTTDLPQSHPERYWLPLIAMLSGMRLAEIAQLYLSDIKEPDGIPVFDVNEEEDKRLKNPTSRRIVPVHPILIELGFLQYVEKMRAQGESRLWPNLQRKREGYGQDFSRWYQRWNRRYVTKNPKRVFHSFRHTVINNLKQEGAKKTVAKELVGHSQGDITYGTYGKGYTPAPLLRELSKLKLGVEGELKGLPRLG